MRNSKLRINIITLVFAGVVLAMGCKHRDENFREISNGDVTIQLTRLADAKQGDGTGFKFRIIPSVTYTSTHNLPTNNFWYHMDSCFYTEKNGLKTFAFVQPVANGQKTNFEYLLQFDPSMASGTDSVKLVYDDKFITHKDYTFNIKL